MADIDELFGVFDQEGGFDESPPANPILIEDEQTKCVEQNK